MTVYIHHIHTQSLILTSHSCVYLSESNCNVFAQDGIRTHEPAPPQKVRRDSALTARPPGLTVLSQIDTSAPPVKIQILNVSICTLGQNKQ